MLTILKSSKQFKLELEIEKNNYVTHHHSELHISSSLTRSMLQNRTRRNLRHRTMCNTYEFATCHCQVQAISMRHVSPTGHVTCQQLATPCFSHSLASCVTLTQRHLRKTKHVACRVCDALCHTSEIQFPRVSHGPARVLPKISPHGFL